MRNYRSTNGAAGSRCISSLFRVIGNLTLNASNTKTFMDANIQAAYASFLEQITDELDDKTLEACFKTLSNLVMEKVSDNRQGPRNFCVRILNYINVTTYYALYKFYFVILSVYASQCESLFCKSVLLSIWETSKLSTACMHRKSYQR